MKKKNIYPEWAEKFRAEGKTIRKVRNGYGLYECTSTYVPGQKYPKSVQKYLGMITEKMVLFQRNLSQILLHFPLSMVSVILSFPISKETCRDLFSIPTWQLLFWELFSIFSVQLILLFSLLLTCPFILKEISSRLQILPLSEGSKLFPIKSVLF